MRSAILAVVLVLLAAAPAVAQQDLRSPDTRDAADRSGQWSTPETSLPGYPTPSDPRRAEQDLRSPDARDAAAGRGTSTAPDVTVVKLPDPAPAPASGIDWADAGLGAAIVLVLGGVSAVAALRRRRPAAPIPA